METQPAGQPRAGVGRNLGGRKLRVYISVLPVTCDSDEPSASLSLSFIICLVERGLW